ncbi:probable apyrase 5 isoform X4 [Coffea arabica]|uniref:Probable apyrase 5 isoform X4 n=1 Tax=Coffea arabica TaxID=13443 RepID=A0A6P6T2T8_COFAR|nr:probable apyrase 5 isoform X4 [Coffea arabica]
MATAGLRMLEKGVQDRILEACRTVLRGSDFRFYDDWASVISGSDEGVYAWVVANYALGTVGGDPKQTTGIIELGGAAAQANDRELQFSIVDGDFKKFEGKWSVKSGKSTMLLNALEEMKKVGFWICS